MSEIMGPDYFYIHPAKTAGTAIAAVLRKQFQGKQSSIAYLPKAVAKGKFVFATVRNPYDRCLSLWWSLCSPGDRYGVVKAGKTTPVDLLRFIASGEFAIHKDTRNVRQLHQTCSEHIGKFKLDAVIRFETLLEDFNKLPFVKKPLTKIPIENRKPHGRPDRRPLSDPEFVCIVREWSAEDFTRFGYDPNVMPKEVN